MKNKNIRRPRVLMWGAVGSAGLGEDCRCRVISECTQQRDENSCVCFISDMFDRLELGSRIPCCLDKV